MSASRPEDVFRAIDPAETRYTTCNWCMEPTDLFFTIPDIVPGRPDIVDYVCRDCACLELAELHLPPSERGVVGDAKGRE